MSADKKDSKIWVQSNDNVGIEVGTSLRSHSIYPVVALLTVCF